MSDRITEVTSESWGSRLAGSIKGVVVGLALSAAAFPLLFWNEGRAVRTARSLDEGAGAVVSVSSDRVDASNEGRLVHTTGETTVSGSLRDPDLGVQATAVKLIRGVEMYQWKESSRSETKKKVGGGTETVTTTTYEKGWAASVIDDSRFKEPAGHANPDRLPLEPATLVAPKVQVGAYTLSEAQVAQLGRSEPLRVEMTPQASDRFGGRLKAQDGTFYLGNDPASPAVGDVRISFEVVKPGPVSLVGRQVAATFEPYRARAGDDILMVRDGTLSAAAMFEAAQSANATLTWILRFVGFLVMFMGLAMFFRPFAVLGDVVPFIGNLVGAGTTVLAGGLAAGLSLSTIAVAWVFYRPLVGILLIAGALAAVAGVVVLARSRRRAQPAAAPAAVA